MVQKEFLMFLTAYNLVRQRVMEAALGTPVEPWRLSFKGTQQVLLEFLPRFHHCVSKEHWCDEILRSVAQLEVGDRPDRVEPRALKRRPRDFPPLKEPRDQFKSRLKYKA